jgi:hypothetical protein
MKNENRDTYPLGIEILFVTVIILVLACIPAIAAFPCYLFVKLLGWKHIGYWICYAVTGCAALLVYWLLYKLLTATMPPKPQDNGVKI